MMIGSDRPVKDSDCRTLWLAVLHRTLLDACSETVENKNSTYPMPHERRSARASLESAEWSWLMGTYCGFDADWFRCRASEFLTRTEDVYLKATGRRRETDPRYAIILEVFSLSSECPTLDLNNRRELADA